MDDLRSTIPPQTPSTGVPQPPKRTSSMKMPIALIALLLLVLAALWFAGSAGDRTQRDLYVDVAPKGEIVGNFPTSLLPEGNPYIEESYSIAYKDSGLEFPVVTFTSTKDFEATIDEFRRLLVDDGWLILKDGSVAETPMTNFDAQKGDAQVNITVEDREAGPWVTIAYSEPR